MSQPTFAKGSPGRSDSVRRTGAPRHAALRSTARLACVALLSVCLSQTAFGRVIRVGPEGDVRTVAESASIAQDGDIVEIAGGVYAGDVAVWRQRELTIRAPGATAVMIAQGRSAERKAIWVIRSGKFRIENIEFRGARVFDGNGAGIRLERGSLSVHGSRFIDNENGILTSNDPTVELHIEDCDFSHAPAQAYPPPHLVYAGRIAKLSVIRSRFHTGDYGHLLKSRARASTVIGNALIDGPLGAASYELEFPNGGDVRVERNVIGQSAGSRNPVMLAYGAEGPQWPVNRLHVEHNTFHSAGWRPMWAIRVWDKGFPSAPQVQTLDNLIAGWGLFDALTGSLGRGNWFTLASVFQDPAQGDYRIKAEAWLRRWLPSVPGAFP